MKGVVFELRGKFAHFRKFYTNSSSLSYSVPPRTTLMGILAAIDGMDRDTYYETLSSENVMITVRHLREVRSIMTTVNYLKADTERQLYRPKSHTQIPLELITHDDEVVYRVYVCNRGFSGFDQLVERLRENRFVYPIGLGIASCIGYVDNVEEVDVVERKSDDYVEIASVIDVERIEDIDIGALKDRSLFKETMPCDFKNDRSLQQARKYLFSKEPGSVAIRTSHEFYKVNGRAFTENVMFM